MLAVLIAGLVASGCQSPRSTFERTFFDPTKPYIGMTKEQVVACAGKPSGSYGTTSGETLTYHYTGAGPVPTAAPAKSGRGQRARSASRNPTRTGNAARASPSKAARLARVTFAPRDVVSPYERKKDPKTGEKVYRDAAGALHLLAAELRALNLACVSLLSQA